MHILLYENEVKPQSGGVQRICVNMATMMKAHGCHVHAVHRVALADDELPDCFDGHLRVDVDDPADVGRLADYANSHGCRLLIHELPENLGKHRRFWDAFRKAWPGRFVGVMQTSPWFYRSRFQHKNWAMPKECLHSIVQQLGHFLYPKDRYLLRVAAELPDCLFVLSQSFIHDWETVTGQSAAGRDIRVCSNFLPDASCPAEVDLSSKEKLALFVGRMEEYPKNVSKILSMWETLSLRFPDWHLCLVGDGPDLPRYRKMAAGLERVVFTGQTDPTPYYQRASLLFVASLWEGLPMVMLEGMAHGIIPVAHLASSALADILPPDGAGGGCLVPYMDWQGFIRAASELMADPARRLVLGERARRTIIDNYSETAAWKHWHAILEEAGEA